MAFHAMRRQSGFSIVELMVGLTIGLIGMLVVYQILISSDAYRRTASESGAAQENGASAMFYIEREARQAGYGVQGLLWDQTTDQLNSNAADLSPLVTRAYGCTVAARDSTRASGAEDFSFSLAPAVITQGASGANDTLTLLHGNARIHAFPAALTEPLSSTSTAIQVKAGMGFDVGDLIVALDVTTATPACEMTQVTSVHAAGGNANCSSVSALHPWCLNGNTTLASTQRFHRDIALSYAGNTSPSLSIAGVVMNLGPAPAVSTYSINGSNQLTVSDAIFPARDSVLADDIVNLQAQWVLDDGQMRDAIPSGMSWMNVKGVRVGLVARSRNYEKDQVSPASMVVLDGADVTGDTPGTYPDVANADRVLMGLSDEARHYRYKVYQTVLPFRSVVWNP